MREKFPAAENFFIFFSFHPAGAAAGFDRNRRPLFLLGFSVLKGGTGGTPENFRVKEGGENGAIDPSGISAFRDRFPPYRTKMRIFNCFSINHGESPSPPVFVSVTDRGGIGSRGLPEPPVSFCRAG